MSTTTTADRQRMAERLRTAFDLFETGVAMMRQRLVRENPGLSTREIDERLRQWLETRPGAEHGDAWGRPGTWPRQPRRLP